MHINPPKSVNENQSRMESYSLKKKGRAHLLILRQRVNSGEGRLGLVDGRKVYRRRRKRGSGGVGLLLDVERHRKVGSVWVGELCRNRRVRSVRQWHGVRRWGRSRHVLKLSLLIEGDKLYVWLRKSRVLKLRWDFDFEERERERSKWRNEGKRVNCTEVPEVSDKSLYLPYSFLTYLYGPFLSWHCTNSPSVVLGKKVNDY